MFILRCKCSNFPVRSAFGDDYLAVDTQRVFLSVYIPWGIWWSLMHKEPYVRKYLQRKKGLPDTQIHII